MKRDDLIAEIAASLGKTKKDTAEFVKAYEEAVVGAVKKGEDVALQGFMRIERKVQKPRKIDRFLNGANNFARNKRANGGEKSGVR